MRHRSNSIIAAALVLCLAPLTANAVITDYSQDFESMFLADTAALDSDGWRVFGNVFESDKVTFAYGYGPFAAPNTGFGFCQLADNQGGIDQGTNQLSVFSDYNNGDHGVGRWIESNVFREYSITTANVGQRWEFAFQTKLGNIELQSTAGAFIKTIDPGNGFALTNLVFVDLTNTPVDWTGESLFLEIDAGLEGQLFQVGFLNVATAFEGSGIFYDNILLQQNYVTAAGDLPANGATLAQNYPNPFNPSTRIDFNLPRSGSVELAIFDIAGRRVATVATGEFEAGAHSVDWNGLNDSGAAVASGNYHYVLSTEEGQVLRGMTLLK